MDAAQSIELPIYFMNKSWNTFWTFLWPENARPTLSVFESRSAGFLSLFIDESVVASLVYEFSRE
jgi:hypothetical protein